MNTYEKAEESARVGGPAFPSSNEFEMGEFRSNGHPGMSLRDYFAGQALVALLTGKNPNKAAILSLGPVCYEVADAMLAEREP